MQIAKGLHRIGSDTVNSYLVVDGDGVTIIDAGLPRYWKLLNNELAQLGLTLDDVRALILTHGDSDHIGFAARPPRWRRSRSVRGRASGNSCSPACSSAAVAGDCGGHQG